MTLASRVAIMNEGILQQVDTPKNIYNDPVNLFVAGFIGSPSMNFFNGDVKNGKFSSEECEFSGLGKDSLNNVVLGVRPEDMEIVSDNNFQFEAKIYSIELTGDQTIVSLKIGSNLITIKEDKDYENELDRIVKIKLNMDKIFLFDTNSGNRINF